jgi:hypothetical protein
MRSDWVPLSASALVVGAMSLVCGSLVNPAGAGSSTSQTVTAVIVDGGRWLTMAVMYTFAAFALTLGLPAVLTLLERRGRTWGVAGAAVFLVGTMGTCGFAMLMVFFRALARTRDVQSSTFDKVADDRALTIFLAGWVLCFYGGVLLLAVGLLRARTTPRWVPWLLVAFVLAMPFASHLGRIGSALQVLAFAAACTGMAMSAVTLVQPTRRLEEPVG